MFTLLVVNAKLETNLVNIFYHGSSRTVLQSGRLSNKSIINVAFMAMPSDSCNEE